MRLYYCLKSRPASHLLSVNSVRNTVNKVFGKYLLLTNTVTCGVLMAAGDIIQQCIEQRSKKVTLDWTRIGRMFVVGVASGPPQHYFYKILDYCIPKRDSRSVLKKILWDQAVASPMCIFIFFCGMGYLEERNQNEIKKEIKEKFGLVYLTDWLVWPPTQFINFYFLHPSYRVSYINFMTMLYNIFLSYVKHDL